MCVRTERDAEGRSRELATSDAAQSAGRSGRWLALHGSLQYFDYFSNSYFIFADRTFVGCPSRENLVIFLRS